jgi:SnoaL-like domain
MHWLTEIGEAMAMRWSTSIDTRHRRPYGGEGESGTQRRRVLGVAYVVVLCGMAVSPRFISGRQAPRATVEQTLSTFLTAFDNLDWPAFRACFNDRPTMFHPSGPNIRRVDIPEEFDAAWKLVFERIRKNSGRTAPPYMKLSPADLRIDPLDENVSLVTFHLIDGQTLSRRTLILRRYDDGWKIVHIHASNLPLR